MGIKHFFGWFRDRFSGRIRKIQKSDTVHLEPDLDNLLIDMNGIFHNSAQKIYKYGEYKQAPRLLGTRNRQGSDASKQRALFKDVCETINSLFLLAKPSKRLILCVDGPAPLSKQCQQRQRRFRSALDRKDLTSFDSNCITPGTKFMDHLTKYIDWYIRKQVSDPTSGWSDIEVIFSNEKSPGEGEHKLLNYIRKIGDRSESYCISGMDADLIMLCLGTGLEKIYILRDDMYDVPGEYFFIDV
jgi:5'-3' exoribonuclease 1